MRNSSKKDVKMLKSLIVKYDYLIKINIYFDDKIKYCSISSMSSLFGLIHLVFLTINNNGEEDCELIINDKSIDYYNIDFLFQIGLRFLKVKVIPNEIKNNIKEILEEYRKRIKN